MFKYKIERAKYNISYLLESNTLWKSLDYTYGLASSTSNSEFSNPKDGKKIKYLESIKNLSA